MAQYLPKTDSQEFEVANADRSPGHWEENVRSESGADITVRVWGADRPSESGPITWRAESVLVYMIADLVAASHGHLAEELPDVMTAHFNNPAQALVAAKRIQISILEFLACRPVQGFGAAILIHPPASSYLSESRQDFVQPALGQARPGQILLAEGIYGTLQNLPGAEFRAIAPLASALEEPQTGLAELIWTSPEHTLRVYATSDRAGEVSGHGSDPAIGATRIVDSPFRKPESLEAGTGGPPVAPSADFVSAPPGEHSGQATSEPFGLAEVRGSATWEPEDANPETLAIDEMQPAKRPITTRTWAIMGVVAVVLVVAFEAVFHRAPSPANPPATQQPAAQGAGSGVGAETQPPVQKQLPPPVEGKPRSDKARSDAKPPKIEKSNEDIVKSKPEPKGGLSVDGFFPSNIPYLLKKAQSDVGSGDYDSAEREYRLILRLQPGNSDATEGLRKLDRIGKVNR